MNPEPQQARRWQRATGVRDCGKGARLLGEQIRDRYERWAWCACAHHTRSRAGNRGCSEHAKMVLRTQTRMFNTAHANEDFTENKHVFMLERNPTRGCRQSVADVLFDKHLSSRQHASPPYRTITPGYSICAAVMDGWDVRSCTIACVPSVLYLKLYTLY